MRGCRYPPKISVPDAFAHTRATVENNGATMNAELVSKLDKIYKRLEALEVVHTRYQGPKGPKGDSGEPGPAGRDGRDSTVAEVNMLRERGIRSPKN